MSHLSQVHLPGAVEECKTQFATIFHFPILLVSLSPILKSFSLFVLSNCAFTRHCACLKMKPKLEKKNFYDTSVKLLICVNANLESKISQFKLKHRTKTQLLS